jgi:N-acetyl-gamma-glutamyl-phosphate reductase
MLMIWVGILGARGYFGEALPKLVAGHRSAQVSAIMDLQGLCESEVYGCRSNESRSGYWSMVNAIKKSDIIFNGLSGSIAEDVYSKAISYGKRVIDIGIEQYNGNGLKKRSINSYPGSVYGLSEFYKDRMKNVSIAGNPSGYCTGAILGLAPLAAFNLADMNTVSIESKSGIASLRADDKLTEAKMTVNGSTTIYKMESIKYAEEVNEQMIELFGKGASASYTAYIIPGIKGITTKVNVNPHAGIYRSNILDAYRDFYKDNPFVEVLSNGMINGVSNGFDRCFCKIGTSVEEDSGKIIVTTVLDDVVKGVAGQAVQTMNLMYGIDGKTGL